MTKIREHRREDIPFRVKWLNNPKATLFAIDDPSHITTEEEQTKWFDDYEANSAKKFFTICDDDRPVGFMGLSDINLDEKTASVFILIGEDDYRGRGVGKESMKYLIDYAHTELGLKSLNLEVNKQNLPALSLFKSAGFTIASETDMEYMIELTIS